ncbi:tRNA pseudouridine synthase B [Candidatus Calditenuaceae archaeon HR02]|nr:tRNA pseudouridine synthase B [Candidatus Calditenuaceae archaeon HR02]
MVGILLRHSTNPWPTEREFVTLREADTDPRYGSRPEERPMHDLLNYGYIPLDKPRGPTSGEITERVRRMLGVERAGHGGTLVPGGWGRSRCLRTPPDPPRKSY